MTETMRAEAGENFGLVQWEATGVRPDGTIDLTDEVVDGTVNYRFERALEPPADQPPLGAGGSMEAVWHDEARVRIRRAGWHHTGTRQDAGGRTVQSYDRTRGLEVRRYDPQPGAPAAAAAPPTCSLAILWEAALAEGAPQAAVARIHYDRQGYEFWISGTDVRLGFTPECELR